MTRFIISSLLIFAFQFLVAQSALPIMNGDSWGFIDSTGKTIINESYKNANWFNEGLAVIRKEGTFGYINNQNKMVIADKYDYAEDFIGNYALVYLDARTLIIDKSGTVIFSPKNNEEIILRKNNLLVVTRDSSNYGIYSLAKNKWLIEPVYSGIDFKNDTLLGIRKKFKQDGEEFYKTAIHSYQSNDLKLLCDFMPVQEINVTEQGEILISYGNGKKSNLLIMSGDGKTLAHHKDRNNSYFNEEKYREGLVLTNNYTGISHIEYIDDKGKKLFNKVNYTAGTSFLNGRALVEVNDENWAIIDKSGKIVSTKRFSHYGPGFSNLKIPNINYCIVRGDNGGTGVINQDGKFIIQPLYSDIDIFDDNQGWFLVTEEDSTDDIFSEKLDEISERLAVLGGHDNKMDTVTKSMEQNQLKNERQDILELMENRPYLGNSVLVDHKGKRVLPGKFKRLNKTKYKSIFYYQIGNEEGYINLEGKIIWKRTYQNESLKKIDTLNIPYMERAYCFAASEELDKEDEGYGGWAHSKNKPKNSDDYAIFKNSSELKLWLDTLSVDTFYNEFVAKKLYLSNGGKNVSVFDAQDSRLYITMQAMDKQGKWSDIEYAPSSWCGNSYHKVRLLSKQVWQFTVPVYNGSFKTKLRFKFVGQRDWKKDHYEIGEIIYSNEFTGSINPAQFWRKKGHNAVSIMDPYNE